MINFVKRNYDLFLGGFILLLMGMAMWGCDFYTPSQPTPTTITSPAPDPPKEEPKPAEPEKQEPFCPDGAPRFTVNATTGGLQFTFEPTLGPKGEFLKRYEVELQRNNNGYNFDSVLQLEGRALSGPHNRLLVIVVKPQPPLNPGAFSARMRSHFPDECRGDGGLRKNGPWSEPPVLFGV